MSRARSSATLVVSAWGLALCAFVGCEDDGASPAPTVEAGSPDSPAPDAAGDSSSPAPDARSDAGSPIDLSTVTWQRLPDLPPDGARVGTESDVAVDAMGRVLVTFGESASGFIAPHSLSVYRFEGTDWARVGGAPLVDGAASTIARPRLALAKDGAIYVSYATGGAAVVQRYSGAAWSTLPAPGFDGTKAITVDAAGFPVVAGFVGSSALTAKRFDGTTWSAELAADVDAGTGSEQGVQALATHPDGSIVGVRRAGQRLRAFRLSGTSVAPLGAEIADGIFPDIALSPTGRLVAAWSGDNVYAAHYDEGTGSFAPLGGALGGPSARYVVAAIDPFDRAFAAWREPLLGIRVSAYATSWQALPAPHAAGGTLPAIHLDGRSLPVISFEAPRDGGGGSLIGVLRAVAP